MSHICSTSSLKPRILRRMMTVRGNVPTVIHYVSGEHTPHTSPRNRWEETCRQIVVSGTRRCTTITSKKTRHLSSNPSSTILDDFNTLSQKRKWRSHDPHSTPYYRTSSFVSPSHPRVRDVVGTPRLKSVKYLYSCCGHENKKFRVYF